MFSADTMERLKQWQKSPNPLERLTTDYYPLRRRHLVRDYETAMAAADDMEDIALARDRFFTCMNDLEQEYRADVMLSCSMHLVSNNVPPGVLLQAYTYPA